MPEIIVPPFPFVKANKHSISKRSLVFGVGDNDADYKVYPTINGKQVKCPFYRVWENMLQRCYSEEYQRRRPTYLNCTVSDDWHSFMIFRGWMEKQNWQGMHLDKDILVEGNKIYAPKYCRFVSRAINALLVDKGRARGEYPIGVYMDKRNGRFEAHCSVIGKGKHLGYFDTPTDAHNAWRAAKAEAIRLTVAAENPVDEIRSALLVRATELEI